MFFSRNIFVTGQARVVVFAGCRFGRDQSLARSATRELPRLLGGEEGRPSECPPWMAITSDLLSNMKNSAMFDEFLDHPSAIVSGNVRST